MTVVILPTDAIKIVIYNVNGDGTLSPSTTPVSAGTPEVPPTTAIPVVMYNTVNGDGTLSPQTV